MIGEYLGRLFLKRIPTACTAVPALSRRQSTGDYVILGQPARHGTDADRTGIWRQPVYTGNRKDRLPPGKSVRARPAGLPGLGKRR
jgi:hypothetical protein